MLVVKRKPLNIVGGNVHRGRFLKKLKIELVHNPTIPLLGIYLKEMKPLSLRDICTSMFIAAVLTVAKV